VTSRTLATLRAVSRNEIAMAKLMEQQAPGSAVKEYASRILAQRTTSVALLGGITQERSIVLDTTPVDPAIRADEATGRDAIDRLTQASGQELDALYLALEATSSMRLSRLADQAEEITRDPELAVLLRRIAYEARDAQARAFARMPRECGGQRDVKPAALSRDPYP
jgi:hypothetical protein